MKKFNEFINESVSTEEMEFIHQFAGVMKELYVVFESDIPHIQKISELSKHKDILVKGEEFFKPRKDAVYIWSDFCETLLLQLRFIDEVVDERWKYCKEEIDLFNYSVNKDIKNIG